MEQTSTKKAKLMKVDNKFVINTMDDARSQEDNVDSQQGSVSDNSCDEYEHFVKILPEEVT